MRPCAGSAHLSPHFTNGFTQARAHFFLPRAPPLLVGTGMKEGTTAYKELGVYLIYFLN